MEHTSTEHTSTITRTLPEWLCCHSSFAPTKMDAAVPNQSKKGNRKAFQSETTYSYSLDCGKEVSFKGEKGLTFFRLHRKRCPMCKDLVLSVAERDDFFVDTKRK